MIIEGIEIHQDLIDEGRLRMRAAPFTAKDVERAIANINTDRKYGDVCAMRLADRLIQRERKAGRIKLERKVWTWVRPV